MGHSKVFTWEKLTFNVGWRQLPADMASSCLGLSPAAGRTCLESPGRG